MQDFTRIFDGVEDPRSSNATLHDLHEMLMIALLCMICGGQSCTDMELFGRSKEDFLRRFMTLRHGIPSHDAFSALFRVLDPGCLQRALVRLAADWAGRFGPEVIAIDGTSSRLGPDLQEVPCLPSARHTDQVDRLPAGAVLLRIAA